MPFIVGGCQPLPQWMTQLDDWTIYGTNFTVFVAADRNDSNGDLIRTTYLFTYNDGACAEEVMTAISLPANECITHGMIQIEVDQPNPAPYVPVYPPPGLGLTQLCDSDEPYDPTQSITSWTFRVGVDGYCEYDPVSDRVWFTTVGFAMSSPDDQQIPQPTLQLTSTFSVAENVCSPYYTDRENFTCPRPLGPPPPSFPPGSTLILDQTFWTYSGLCNDTSVLTSVSRTLANQCGFYMNGLYQLQQCPDPANSSQIMWSGWNDDQCTIPSTSSQTNQTTPLGCVAGGSFFGAFSDLYTCITVPTIAEAQA